MAFWSGWFGKKDAPPTATPAAAPVASPPAAPAAPPDFPYPLVAVPGRDAVAEWRRLREAWRAEGRYPVMLGHAGDVRDLAAALSGAGAPEEHLRAAEGVSLDAFFEARLAEVGERDGEEADLFLGEWPAPGTAPPHVPGAHADLLTGKPRPLVYMASLPTANPWEAFAYLGYGGWNACPGPEEQVSVHRRWHERYGAEPYAVCGDVLECLVSRPPADREAAEALAREQYLYCPDIVEQGTQDLRTLAATLLDGPAWFFWWD